MFILGIVLGIVKEGLGDFRGRELDLLLVIFIGMFLVVIFVLIIMWFFVWIGWIVWGDVVIFVKEELWEYGKIFVIKLIMENYVYGKCFRWYC